MSTTPQDQSTILYRLNSLEQSVKQLQEQLKLYIPMREHELQVQIIHDTVQRIEHDVQEAKKQLTGMSTQLVNQEAEAQKRDAASRESLDRLQIRVLWGVVSTVITALVLLLVAYFTHLIH